MEQTWFCYRKRQARFLLSCLLSFSLLAQGCGGSSGGSAGTGAVTSGSLTGSSLGTRTSAGSDSSSGSSAPAAVLAITDPSRGFVNQPIVWVKGTAPAGSTVTILDGPTVIGQGTAASDGTFSIGVTFLGEGVHLLRADAAGIGSSAAVKVTVDLTAPTASFLEIPFSVVSEPYAKFRWMASEDSALFSYTLDGQAASPFTLADRIGINDLSLGTHTFTVVAKDLAGNQSSPISHTFAYQLPSHPKLANLTILPNPFTPNGDGVKDTIGISASMADGLVHSWSITIKNSGGTVSKTFSGSGSSLSATWDGKNSMGALQLPAEYPTDITVEGITQTFPIYLSSVETSNVNETFPILALPASRLELKIDRQYRSDKASQNKAGSFGIGGFGGGLDDVFSVSSALDTDYASPNNELAKFPFAKKWAGATATYYREWAKPSYHAFDDASPNPPEFLVWDGTEYSNWDDFEPYHPTGFVWMDPQGMTRVLDTGIGLKRIQESNGNFISYSPNSIQHSSGKTIQLARDSQNRITKVTDPKGNSSLFSYSATGELSSVTNPLGQTDGFLYGPNHRLEKIVGPQGLPKALLDYTSVGVGTIKDAANYSTQISPRANQLKMSDRRGFTNAATFVGEGQIAKSVNPLGEVIDFEYDLQSRRMTKVTRPLGQPETLQYDSNGNLTKKVDLYGNTSLFTVDTVTGRLLKSEVVGGDTWNYAYDAKGNLSQKGHTSEGITQTHTYTYHPDGNLKTEQTSDGSVVSYAYDALGNLTEQSNSSGEKIQRAYDANGYRTQEKRYKADGSLVDTTTFAYDAMKRLTQIVSQDGTREYGYGTDGNITAMKHIGSDGSLQSAELTYGPRGELKGVVYSGGGSIDYSYDPEGNPVEEQRNGKVTYFDQYDELGRRIRRVTPEGDASYWRYDALGRTIEQGEPTGCVTAFTYDSKGRIATQKRNGITTSYTYDISNHVIGISVSNGAGSWSKTIDPSTQRIISTTDPSGMTTSYQYDSVGNLVKVLQPNPDDPNGAPVATVYTYDSQGHRLSQTDAEGRTTFWTYDGSGHVASRTLPLGQTEYFTYNTAGQLIKHKTFRGYEIQFTYTSVGKLYQKIAPDGTVTYIYDTQGKLVEVLDGLGSTKRVYDEPGRLAYAVDHNNHAIGYEYDPMGLVTKLGTSVGQTQYGFDAKGRLVWMTNSDAQTTTYTYDGCSDRRTRVDHANGTVEKVEYGSVGGVSRLVHQDAIGQVLHEFIYTRDAMGRVMQVVEDIGRKVRYAYDGLGRLKEEETTEATGQTKKVMYAYDRVGNRLSKTEEGTVTQYQYDGNDRLISESGASSKQYQYDASGNTVGVSGGGTNNAYQYDTHERLVWAQMGGPGMMGGGTTLAYAYDSEGVRVRKQVNGTLSIDWVVDRNRPYSQVLAEYRAGQLVATYEAIGVGKRGNEVVGVRVGGTRYTYHHDGANYSVRMLTGAQGQSFQKYDRDAFGNVPSSGTSTGTSWVNPYGYGGEEEDAELGLNYHRARYYSPRIGRFQTMDSWAGDPADPSSLHKYLYAANDPINRVDPSGSSWFSFQGLLAALYMAEILIAQVLTSAVVTSAIYSAVTVAAGIFILSLITLAFVNLLEYFFGPHPALDSAEAALQQMIMISGAIFTFGIALWALRDYYSSYLWRYNLEVDDFQILNPEVATMPATLNGKPTNVGNLCVQWGKVWDDKPGRAGVLVRLGRSPLSFYDKKTGSSAWAYPGYAQLQNGEEYPLVVQAATGKHTIEFLERKMEAGQRLAGWGYQRVGILQFSNNGQKFYAMRMADPKMVIGEKDAAQWFLQYGDTGQKALQRYVQSRSQMQMDAAMVAQSLGTMEDINVAATISEGGNAFILKDILPKFLSTNYVPPQDVFFIIDSVQ